MMTFSSKKKLFFFSALFYLGKPMKFSDNQIDFLEKYFKKMEIACDLEELKKASVVSTNSYRCAGKTKKGTDCKKIAVSGKKMCSYHQKDEPEVIKSTLSEETVVGSDGEESDGGHSAYSLNEKKSKELDELFGEDSEDEREF